ncbi:hypothetical protein LXA43DRAFT_468706 [Ganoderma leucocontextum]|nr:hypothetical protein LXA43DRAFT_468706 [Ganoderma leucocontextum]
MSRPRNNLDELQRKHALPAVSSPTKLATPQTGGGKGKFKPAKSIPASTPATATVKRLGSWSTPGFGRTKPSPLTFPSVADNSVSYIDVSSTESIPGNASTSSIPSKRLSSGCPEDLFPTISPKRPKTDHVLGKENFPYSDPKGKGKARAREPPRPPVSIRTQPSHIALPNPHTQAYAPLQLPKPVLSLRVAFEALAPEADLREV